jgi:hypothetical protein
MIIDNPAAGSDLYQSPTPIRFINATLNENRVLKGAHPTPHRLRQVEAEVGEVAR